MLNECEVKWSERWWRPHREERSNSLFLTTHNTCCYISLHLFLLIGSSFFLSEWRDQAAAWGVDTEKNLLLLFFLSRWLFFLRFFFTLPVVSQARSSPRRFCHFLPGEIFQKLFSSSSSSSSCSSTSVKQPAKSLPALWISKDILSLAKS